MRKITILAFLISCFSLSAQTFTDTIWFNKEWKSQVKDSAVYFRVVNRKEIRFKDFFEFKDFDMVGTKIKEGVSTKRESDSFEGELLYFHNDGSIAESKMFKNGFPFGAHKVFYKSGKPKTVRTYLFGVLKGASKTYNEDGKLIESGTYIKDKREGTWKTYYLNGKVKEQGVYSKGLKVGVWKVYYYNGTSQD